MITIKIERQKFRYDLSPCEHLIFLTVGMAIARVQAFENLVAIIIGSIFEPKNREITIENIDKEISRFDRQTLGILINLMKERVAGEDLHNKLVSVRDGRNFIAHWSLRSYTDLDEEQAVHLVEKIESILVEFDEVQDLLIAELSDQDVTHISEIYIDEDTGEIKDVNNG